MMLLLLAVLTVANHVLAGVYQVPLIKIQSKMVQMLRAGSWAAHIEEMRAKHHKVVEAPAARSDSSQKVSI